MKAHCLQNWYSLNFYLQLQNILHQFPSRHVRDHLYYVIANANTNTATVSMPDVKAVLTGGLASGSHDLRSSLYARIGVHAERG